MIFSGAQLLALGIIGEYLARMHFRTMERPPYAVREQTAAGNPRFGSTIKAITTSRGSDHAAGDSTESR